MSRRNRKFSKSVRMAPPRDETITYVFSGRVEHGDSRGNQGFISTGHHHSGKAVRFLLISGKRIGEPVTWYGPIVMNAQEEFKQAFKELDSGTFIRDKRVDNRVKSSKVTG